MKEQDDQQWDIVIKPSAKSFNLNLSELWRYRDLLFMFVKRDIVVTYKQTVLGPLWFFIQPVFTTIMFMFVFGGIAGISTDGLPQPLFYMAGILCWNYFSDCIGRSTSTFNANAGIFSKVYFPRLIAPISAIISNLIKFVIQFGLFLAVYIYFFLNGANVSMNLYALLFPLLLFMIAGIALGIGILISSMTIKYRDLGYLFSFLISLVMYVTPIIYPLTAIPPKYQEWKWIIQLNPLTSIVETFRYVFLGTGTFSWYTLGYSFIFTIVILLIGARTFNKVERNFIDIV